MLNKKKGSNKQLGFTQSNQLYFHRVIKVINFAVQLHFLILMIITVCRENSMPIILIIKIKTANLIIRKRGENNLYHFSFSFSFFALFFPITFSIFPFATQTNKKQTNSCLISISFSFSNSFLYFNIHRKKKLCRNYVCS